MPGPAGWKGELAMLQMETFNYQKVEYIVLDTAVISLDREGMATLASYGSGVGAERLLLVDKNLGQLICATDNKGHYQILSMADRQVAEVALGRAGIPEGMYHGELRLTEYFLQKLLPADLTLQIAV